MLFTCMVLFKGARADLGRVGTAEGPSRNVCACRAGDLVAAGSAALPGELFSSGCTAFFPTVDFAG
jgi:hypothetical protein